MPQIVFIEHNGTQHVIEAPVSNSVMRIAVENMVPGIVGDCGGSCSCATCHAYVEGPAAENLAPAGEDETMMLESAVEVKPNSRLTCQIVVQPELDGLIVRLPMSQF